MYVLEGEYLFQVGDDVAEGSPGACAFMPRNVGHAWKCVGPKEGKAFFIYTPGVAGHVFEEAAKLQIAAPITADVDPALEELFERYGWEVLGPPPF